ncbi:unnamed protein product, partial [Larinioides sclopetarius]
MNIYFQNIPGPSSHEPALIEERGYYENLENTIILNETNRRRNAIYNASEITFQ